MNDVTFPSRVTGKIVCDYNSKENVLGEGGYGHVFRGSYEGQDVAIKRIIESRAEIREFKAQMKLEHDNVLKILTVEQDDNFRYIVLELCAGTLTNVCFKKYNGPELPSDRIVLMSIYSGLHHIHSKKLVHRDIKPDNILVSLDGKIKISDFGLSKETSTNHTYELSLPLRGTIFWLAPELQKIAIMPRNETDPPVKDSEKSDIFSAGLVSFFYITRGLHPHGRDPHAISRNILMNKQLYGLRKCHFASHVINQMILHDSGSRMCLTEAMEIIQRSDGHDLITISDETTFPLNSLVIKNGDVFEDVNHAHEEKGILQVKYAKFHPFHPVLACALRDGRVVLLKGTDQFVPFSDWEIEKQLDTGSLCIELLEWNVDGTQLACCHENFIVVWRYPNEEAPLKIKFRETRAQSESIICWNAFNFNGFATYAWETDELLIGNSDSKSDMLRQLKLNSDGLDAEWISNDRIACSNADGIIDIYQAKDGSTIKRLVHGDDRVWSIAWNEELKYLASGSADCTIKIWTIEENAPVHTLNVDSDCFCVGWRPNGKQESGFASSRFSDEKPLLVGGLGTGAIVIWSPLQSEMPAARYLKKHSEIVSQILFSTDGRFLASYASSKEIIIWSAETWLSVHTLPATDYKLITLSWNATSSALSVSDNSGEKQLRVMECVLDEQPIEA